MNKLYKALILILISNTAFSQIKYPNYEIGNYVDMDQNIIEGYDDVDYSPEKPLKVNISVGENFTPGHYYDLKKQKIVGLIKYKQNNTFFEFKETAGDKSRTMKPDAVSSYVIGKDSFVVFQDFYVQRALGGFLSEDREFAEVIDKFDKYIFYKHLRVNGNNIVETYYYEIAGTNQIISFPKNSEKFKKLAAPLFLISNEITRKINNSEYSSTDIPLLLKLLKYKIKLDKNEKILFDNSWEETEDASKANYFAKVVSIKDTLFNLKYFINNSENTPMYEGGFTSFYPHKKHGDFIWYYPSGTQRKKAAFFKDDKISETLYQNNGKIKTVCSIQNNRRTYSKVINLLDQNILDPEGNGTEVYYDSIRSKEITRVYSKFELHESWYTNEKNEKIYLLSHKNAKLQYRGPIQTIINDTYKYPLSTFKNQTHGVMLLKCIIEPTGIVREMGVIKSLDSTSSETFVNMIGFIKNDHWKPGKSGKINIIQEVIIPVEFNINGFSRYRNNYYNSNFMFQQQMMMHNFTPMHIPGRF